MKKILGKTLFTGILLMFVLRAVTAAVAPLTDNSEGRYAEMCRNMAKTGNFLEPMFWHDGVYQSFDGKPPFFFWMGGWSIRLFGCNEFAVRLPSLLAAVLTVLAVWFVLARFRNRTAAGMGAFMLVSGAFFYLFSGAVITDMILCLSISGALFAYMFFLAEPERKNRKLASLVMFALLGLGMLTKGPVAIVLFGMPAFFWHLLNKEWKILKDHAWVTGIILFLVISVPWFYLMHRENPGFLEYFFVNENFLRFVSHEYGDRYGAGRELHYGASIWAFLVVNFPWVLTAAYVLIRKSTRPVLNVKNPSADPVEGLAFLGFIVPTLFWALTSRLTVSYLLPTAPMFAVWLAARLFAEPEVGKPFRRQILILGWCSVLLVSAGLIASIWLAPMAGKTTTKLIRDFRALQAERPEYASSRLYILRSLPYSQNFYAPELFVQHPKEPVSEGLVRGAGNVFAATSRQFKKVNPEDVSVLKRSGDFTIFVLKEKEE